MSKKVLITGATSGLGLSHAIYLQNKGYEVMGVARSLPDLKILRQRFETDNSKYSIKDGIVKKKKSLVPIEIERNLEHILEEIEFKACDVTDRTALDSFFSFLENHWNGLDILVNNAGFGLFGSVLQMDLEKERKQYEVNVLSNLELIRRSIPFLLRGVSPKIVNTASLAAYFGIPFQGHYSSSKAAIHNITESVRHELKPLGIQICSLDPGDINTSFNARSVTETSENSVYMLDLNGLLNSMEGLPVPSYFADSQQTEFRRLETEVWRHIVKNLILAPPPLVVSRKLEKIISKTKLKPHYKVGSRFQVLAISAAQRIFTENFANYLMAKFYGL